MDFPRPNLEPVFPQFCPIQIQKFPNCIINFPISDFVLQFGENFMKITAKIMKLQLITFRFMVGFDEYF